MGQAAPAQSFVVCGSQPNEPTVYFSGVMVGPATAFNGFRTGFSDYLTQQHAYKGAVGCVPARDAVQAQKLLTDRSTALRNAKKVVVDTGWTESAAAATPAPVLPVAQNKAVVPVGATAAVAAKPATAATAAGAATAATGTAGSASTFASTLGTIFGTGGAAGGTSGPAGAAGKSGAAGTTAAAGGAGGGAGGQSPFQQVSSTLTTVFASSKSGGGAAPADAGARSAPPASSDTGLGSAQSGTTKLVVDGCGRQDTRVACVTELTNQNQKDTLVQASDVWADAFIVDDRGDRHARTSAFFLNVDGDQRPQLDISYGKTARFILMFDDVPAKVQKVTLRSGGGLDVEDVSLIAPNTQSGQHH